MPWLALVGVFLKKAYLKLLGPLGPQSELKSILALRKGLGQKPHLIGLAGPSPRILQTMATCPGPSKQNARSSCLYGLGGPYMLGNPSLRT